MKFYLDTSIWIDLYENRGYNSVVAKKFIENVVNLGATILYTDAVISELKKLEYFPDEIFSLFKSMIDLKKVQITKKQYVMALKLSKQRNLPRSDVLHALIAGENEATLVSRDWDFQRLKDLVLVTLPEDAI